MSRWMGELSVRSVEVSFIHSLMITSDLCLLGLQDEMEEDEIDKSLRDARNDVIPSTPIRNQHVSRTARAY